MPMFLRFVAQFDQLVVPSNCIVYLCQETAFYGYNLEWSVYQTREVFL